MQRFLLQLKMYSKKFATMALMPHRSQGDEQLSNIGALRGSPVNSTASSGVGGKQRLRWTSDLHDRFVDAITQLGGPDSGYFVCSLFFPFSSRRKLLLERNSLGVSIVSMVIRT